MGSISSFSGEYRWLSNFYSVNILFDGRLYPSVENAYQAAKAHPSQRAKFCTCSAAEAKHMGRLAPLPPGWETERVSVMGTLLRDKFSYRSTLAGMLVATHPLELEEGNNWGDRFWGVCDGEGENMLGKLLMHRRQQLVDMQRAHKHNG